MPELKAEPALALTLTGEPPPNDGFLTMSEVLKLNLNTDWAILSACNTAGLTWPRNLEQIWNFFLSKVYHLCIFT